MVDKHYGGLSFKLHKDHDFSFLEQFGNVFKVFDQQDSGNICFGVTADTQKYFIKYAGAETEHYQGSTEDAIITLKEAEGRYRDLQGETLLMLISSFSTSSGYGLVFEWLEAESMHAHWLFDEIPKYTDPRSANYRFLQLPLTIKYQAFEQLIAFIEHVHHQGYIAIDLYDGNIMYDFKQNHFKVIDVDLYHKGNYINETGEMWGSDRFKALEEYSVGGVVDECSNVYTLAALGFELLGNNKTRSYDDFLGSKAIYHVLQKATRKHKEDRYQTIEAFKDDYFRAKRSSI